MVITKTTTATRTTTTTTVSKASKTGQSRMNGPNNQQSSNKQVNINDVLMNSRSSSNLNLSSNANQSNGQHFNSTGQSIDQNNGIDMTLIGKDMNGRSLVYKNVGRAIAGNYFQFKSTSKELRPVVSNLIQDFTELFDKLNAQEQEESSELNLQSGNDEIKNREIRFLKAMVDDLNDEIERTKNELKNSQTELKMIKEYGAVRRSQNEGENSFTEFNCNEDNHCRQIDTTRYPTLDGRSYSEILKTKSNKIRENKSKSRSTILVIEKQKTSLVKSNDLYEKVSTSLSAIDKDVGFEEVTLNKSGKIIVKFKEDKHEQLVREKLMEFEKEMDMHKLRSNKSIMIKSIPKQITKEQIEKELVETYNVNGQIRTRLISNPAFKFNRCAVVLNEESAVHLCELDHIRLGFRACKVEPNHTPVQCINCYRFGHVAYRNGQLICRNEPVCIECSHNHKTSEHKSVESAEKEEGGSESEIDIIKCSNCKQSGHKANSKECQIYKNIQKRLIDKW